MDAKKNKNGYPSGERHHRARFTDHEIELVRQLRADGMKIGDIARKMEMARSHVWRVLHYVNR